MLKLNKLVNVLQNMCHCGYSGYDLYVGDVPVEELSASAFNNTIKVELFDAKGNKLQEMEGRTCS